MLVTDHGFPCLFAVECIQCPEQLLLRLYRRNGHAPVLKAFQVLAFTAWDRGYMNQRNSRNCSLRGGKSSRLCQIKVTGLQIIRHLIRKVKRYHLLAGMCFQLIIELLKASAKNDEPYLLFVFITLQQVLHDLLNVSGSHASTRYENVMLILLKTKLFNGLPTGFLL